MTGAAYFWRSMVLVTVRTCTKPVFSATPGRSPLAGEASAGPTAPATRAAERTPERTAEEAARAAVRRRPREVGRGSRLRMGHEYTSVSVQKSNPDPPV